MTIQRLKLLIEDADDLAVAATVLQDAIVPAADIAYLPEDRRFVFVANRFCWEGAPEDKARAPFERVNCGVTFDGIRAVRSREIDPGGTGMLSLLTVGVDADAIMLVFAGGGAIRLEVDTIRGHMEDIGEPWPTQSRPRHVEVGTPEGNSSDLD